MLLKPRRESHGPLARFFAWFNRMFRRTTDGYISLSAVLIRKAALSLIFLVVISIVAVFISSKLPGSFLPEEDGGYVYVSMQLPNAASLQRRSAPIAVQLLTNSAQDAARLSELRYRGGATSYLGVLTSETNAFSAELNLARAQLNERLSLVQIYNALGGGWQ